MMKILFTRISGSIVGLCLVLLPFELAAQDRVVQVPRGDAAALLIELEKAALRPPSEATELVINGTYSLFQQHELPAIGSNLTIRGGRQGAIITSGEYWQWSFNVGNRGSLTLVNIEFSDFRLDGEVIVNAGSLTLDRVKFTRVRAHPLCLNFGRCLWFGRIVRNEQSGQVLFDRVSVVDSGSSAYGWLAPGSIMQNEGEAEIRNFQLYLRSGLREAVFHNLGSLRISNATLSAIDGDPDRELFTLFENAGSPDVEISNSIISGFGADWCAYARSRGHNLVDDAGCSFTNEGDLVGFDAELIWAPVTANWNPPGKELLTKALIPLADSPAIDSGSPDACLLGSLLGTGRDSTDGDGDGLAACDRGAVERAPSTIAQGGINGLYFNPEADGHYLYIADTANPVMVMWTTFDANGDPAWIFGLADRVRHNGRVLADAYINRDGRVRLDGRLVPAESERWGTLDVRMHSCNGGKLIFSSDQPGFGSGEFRFQRLAFVDQLGCIDSQ